ncbi:thioredoxin domain-containing protein [Nonomuraea sp. B1E8]|uniref:thioredoxin domain-containing protein n=1 Tax=unclassified Nonomuraea TaxID=2593643 RepID=UPI00325CE26E
MPAPTRSPVDTVTERTFAERVLRPERPVLIRFWTTWCHSCRKHLAARHVVEQQVVPALRKGDDAG